MLNDLPAEYRHEEAERNAYNAAFHELGFRWYWDSDTYRGLLARGANPGDRIRHYLETRQAHLLKAYDAGFLVDVIQEKMARHRSRGAADATRSRPFDWATTLGGELGA